jgi:O-antigen ligase
MDTLEHMLLPIDSPLAESKRSFGSMILAYCIALPLFGRAVFPLARDKEHISLASSFTDPQIVATYLAAAVVTIGLCTISNHSMQAKRGRLGLMFMLFVAACLASSFGSNFPLLAVWRSFEIFVLGLWLIVMIRNAANTGDFSQAIRAFYAVSIGILLGVLIGLIINPSGAWAVEGEIARLTGTTGYSINSNDIGTIAAVLAVGSFLRAVERGRVKFFVATALFIGVCYLSYSRASYIALAIGFVAATAMLGRVAGRRVIAFFITLSVVLCIVAIVLVSHEVRGYLLFLMTRGYEAQNVESLGGRVQLWELGLKVFGAHPFLGTGYGTYPEGLQGGHFHNVIIELLVTTGAVGTFAYIAFLLTLIAVIKGAIRRTNRNAATERISAADLVTIPIIIITANGATSGAAHYSWDLLGLVSVAVSANTFMSKQGIANERRSAQMRFSNLLR